mmetsp:Transcript_17796/g.48402  ORF Transcript_17796/g.48402 Transcript_17796/m.48402 type:complete len:257 (+) Transcript_17796:324-1094(+)
MTMRAISLLRLFVGFQFFGSPFPSQQPPFILGRRGVNGFQQEFFLRKIDAMAFSFLPRPFGSRQFSFGRRRGGRCCGRCGRGAHRHFHGHGGCFPYRTAAATITPGTPTTGSIVVATIVVVVVVRNSVASRSIPRRVFGLLCGTAHMPCCRCRRRRLIGPSHRRCRSYGYRWWKTSHGWHHEYSGSDKARRHDCCCGSSSSSSGYNGNWTMNGRHIEHNPRIISVSHNSSRSSNQGSPSTTATTPCQITSRLGNAL